MANGLAEGAPHRASWRLADLLLSAVWTGTLLLIWRVRLDVAWFEENAPVEALQSVYLLAAAGLFARCALRRDERPYRLELLGIALFTFCMCVRETDVRGTWAEPAFGAAQKAGWQWVAVALLWLPVLGFSLARLRPTLGNLLQWLRTPAGTVMFLGGIWYLVGDRAEKGWLSRDADTSKILEESAETVGCLLILAAAYLVLRNRFLRRG